MMKEKEMKFKAIIVLSSILVLLFLHASLCAQSFNISPQAYDDDGFEFMRVLGSTSNGVYVLQSNISLDKGYNRLGFKLRKSRVVFFNFDAKEKWRLPIDIEFENSTLMGIELFNNQLVLAYTQELKNDNYRINFHLINDKGKINKDTLHRLQVTLADSRAIDRILLTRSSGNNYFVVSLQAFERSNQTFHFYVCDTGLQQFSHHTIAIGLDESHYIPDAFDVSNFGDVVLTGVESQNKRIRDDRMNDSAKYVLHISPAGGDNSIAYEFVAASKVIHEASVTFDNKNRQVVVVGLYVESTGESASGVALGRFSVTTPAPVQITCARYIENPLAARSREEGIGQFTIDKIILRNDGGALLIAENFFKEEFQYYDYFTQTFQHRFEYHYDNVAIVSINKDGSIDWARKVKKEQNSTNDGGVYLSYATANSFGKIMIYYNRDWVRNNEVIGATINNIGELADTDVFRGIDKVLILPRESKQVSIDQVAVPIIEKKKLKLAIVTFE
ncbi:MAG: hypothetical protein IPO27_03005 [Bacteroidetes bacterium]|nr:hypothetical protein [Bacteroidota bacterium]